MIPEQIDRRHPLPDLPRHMSARQAFAIAAPVVRAYDTAARFVQIKSNLSINHHGFATGWDFSFDLPHEQAQVFVYVRWHSNPASTEDGTGELRELVRPFMPRDSVVWQVIREGRVPESYVGTPPGDAMEALLQRGELTPDWIEQRWQLQMASRPVLPTPFHDSPHAVHALTEQGADFESGPTDMQLESRILPGGQAVWWVACYRDYTTPFAE